MVTAYDISATDLIKAISEDFKTFAEIVPPSWASFVKTGVNRELPPENPDWWYVRSAAVLRKIYMKGPLGTRRLKAMYGGGKNRGTKTEKARAGSGSIARKILQQVESAKRVETIPNGRQITAKGMSFVDDLAHRSLK